jgi:hypothetical protein
MLSGHISHTKQVAGKETRLTLVEGTPIWNPGQNPAILQGFLDFPQSLHKQCRFKGKGKSFPRA